MTTQEILEAARGAKTAVALSDSGTRDSALYGMADALCAPESMDAILAANAEDMAAAKGRISDVMLDRLALTPQRIEAMAKGIRDVAALPDPVGRVLSHIERPNGLVIEKTAVPMGVIAIIYESDPFQHLDQIGVGKLVKMAAHDGRETRPDLGLGICGEHGGDPTSVEFCHNVGLDYVSCSPFRVPIARLAAAQAAIKNPRK